ncbi:uncharacterized protein L3040_006047 [Drepanopeziza brunnea f. sp. 'multigermtubi']|uniref:uncharacterized protein n=1 Tax=Drepanopeziza brunnea f. sp. 'multigermtubi' TaxID=698441 RepID=UPI0023896FB1|nr:hypothetical protein L3040_006047 [Drepanopeziza brunnea f. sp. 'multigermtubi']
MRLTLLAAALAPLLAAADTYPAAPPTATIVSTARFTKTITVSEVVASVYLTRPASSNTSPDVASTTVSTRPSSTIVSSAISSTTASNVYVNIATGGATPTGYTGSPATPLPPNFVGAASSLSGMWAGGAGLMACAVAMML